MRSKRVPSQTSSGPLVRAVEPSRLKPMLKPTMMVSKMAIQAKMSSNILEKEICNRPMFLKALNKRSNLMVTNTGSQMNRPSAMMVAALYSNGLSSV